jgi:hypothetical protein
MEHHMELRRRGVVLGLAAAVIGTTVAAAPPSPKPIVRYDAITVTGPNDTELTRRTEILKTVVDPHQVPGAMTAEEAKRAQTPLSAPKPRRGRPGPAGQPPVAPAPSRGAGGISIQSVPIYGPQGSQKGWQCDPGFVERFAACAEGRFLLRKLVTVNGVTTVRGTASARVVTVAFGGDSSTREFEVLVQFHDFVTTDDWNAAPLRITGDAVCTSPCRSANGTEAPNPVAVWRGNLGGVETIRHFRVPTGSGPNVVGFGTFRPYMAVADDSPNGGVASAFGTATTIRCDTTGITSGCVFGQAPSTIDYLTADRTRPEGSSPQVAQHIWDAWMNPTRTLPAYPDKRVPGREGSGRPLHRIANTDPQYSRNGITAVNTCKFFWGVNYTAGRTRDCDEFPFRSAREGAARPPLPNHHWSARPLSLNDNRRAGGRLSAYFTSDRVLPGDPFYVAVWSHY